MAITPEQVKDVEQLRTSIHGLISKGVADEYLLATYNGIVRHINKRLPNIRKLAEGKDLVAESRSIVSQQRQAMSQKTSTPTTKPHGSAQKSG